MSPAASPEPAVLPVPPQGVIARRPLGRWLLAVGGPGVWGHAEPEQRPWYAVLWLTGVDYFSSLGYAPGIALLAAGPIAPLATGILVLVTLFGALPVYNQVACRSFTGQGSIELLIRLVRGWGGKALMLVLLGFAATDFVITMTLSAADAARHTVANPYLAPYLAEAQMPITLGLLALLAGIFLRGFAEAIHVATAVAVPYMLLNTVVAARALFELGHHPEWLSRWDAALLARGDWSQLAIAAALVFPRLALGMSGFETGVSVMPLVRGDAGDDSAAVPSGRIRNTHRMQLTAAVLMGIMLLAMNTLGTLLVPEADYRGGGPASGRVPSFMAHMLLGNGFGTGYDLSTILILWFAGASAMAGLLNLLPRYLPAAGMAPRWAAYSRPLVLALFAVDVAVTLIFKANVDAQGSAYATGVLVLMFTGALAIAILEARDARAAHRPFPPRAVFFWVVTVVFGYTLVQNVHLRPAGLVVASIFIAFLALVAVHSRWRRAREFRVASSAFADAESAVVWEDVVEKAVLVVPVASGQWPVASGQTAVEEIPAAQEGEKPEGPVVFLHVGPLSDPSQFEADLALRVQQVGADFLIEVTGAVAAANAIAYVASLLPRARLALDKPGPARAGDALRYLVTGRGECERLVPVILRAGKPGQ